MLSILQQRTLPVESINSNLGKVCLDVLDVPRGRRAGSRPSASSQHLEGSEIWGLEWQKFPIKELYIQSLRLTHAVFRADLSYHRIQEGAVTFIWQLSRIRIWQSSRIRPAPEPHSPSTASCCGCVTSLSLLTSR